ncbi:hypothetical protein SASPL_129282 [Salvia splendens]|uniref:Gag1-like clamp domain-containing protein n=1 Tax=Salvia splendens TaxID=180675 RepID=A0A8X8XEQ5_SALSN|nr:hypothetical protein SASPL_129282 [Salvia splendens]
MHRSCIGCCDKSQPITAVDEPSKGLRIQGQLVKKQSISDDFWSTSTCDLLENSTLQSQRSYSSISVSNQSVSCSGSASNPPEFINHGKSAAMEPKPLSMDVDFLSHSLTLWRPYSWNASYENLLGTSKRFPQPVPLSEMVDFLVDIWDQEGLYD